MHRAKLSRAVTNRAECHRDQHLRAVLLSAQSLRRTGHRQLSRAAARYGVEENASPASSSSRQSGVGDRGLLFAALLPPKKCNGLTQGRHTKIRRGKHASALAGLSPFVSCRFGINFFIAGRVSKSTALKTSTVKEPQLRCTHARVVWHTQSSRRAQSSTSDVGLGQE